MHGYSTLVNSMDLFGVASSLPQNPQKSCFSMQSRQKPKKNTLSGAYFGAEDEFGAEWT